MGFFWGWYGLSANDLSMGMHFFSRDLHDQVFGLYSNILNIPADELATMAAKACIVDTFIVLGILAVRYRKSWMPAVFDWMNARRVVSSK